MSKLNYLLPIALLASSATFAASGDTWYTGARLGGTHYSDISENNITNKDLDKDDWAAGAFVGYNFTSWFALEAGYTYLGEMAFTETASVEQQGFDLVGKFSKDLTKSLDVYAKLGGSHYLAHGQDALDGFDDKGLVGTAGLGLEYFFNKKLSARIEYQYYNQLGLEDKGFDADWNTHFYGLSLVYTWAAEKAVPVMPAPMVEPEVVAQPVIIEPLTVEVYFENSSDALQTQYVEQLAPIAEHLINYPEAKLFVVGHTDSQGSEQLNQKLSEQRAARVASYLAKEFNIDKTRIIAEGRGELEPIATNESKEGRAKNRRVSVFTPGLEVSAEQ